MLAMNGSPDRSTSVSLGLSAWSSEPGVVPEDVGHLAGREAGLDDVVALGALGPRLERDRDVRVQRRVGIGERLRPSDRDVGAVDEEGELDGVLRQRGRRQRSCGERDEGGDAQRDPLLPLHGLLLR